MLLRERKNAGDRRLPLLLCNNKSMCFHTSLSGSVGELGKPAIEARTTPSPTIGEGEGWGVKVPILHCSYRKRRNLDTPPRLPYCRGGVLRCGNRSFCRMGQAGQGMPYMRWLPLLCRCGFDTVRVGTKPLPCASLVQRQVPAQPLRSLDSATGGAPLRPPTAARSPLKGGTRGRNSNHPEGIPQLFTIHASLFPKIYPPGRLPIFS